MDRAATLEALREEDGESVRSFDSEGGIRGDGGIRRGDPNKFDSLCDGVLGTLALVHSALQEIMEIKDELLKHALPANVQTKVSLASSKLYRSVSDMHVPVNELIRMVRIYSTPWEEKSAALKKLHDDYDAKKSQLNIAIKRLQLLDARSRQMNREKRIMNWEKLFSRVTTARGHGRRWKFLIDSFKRKAKEGIPALQKYLDEIEHASDSEDDDDDPEPVYPVDTQVDRLEFPDEDAEDDEVTESEEDSDSDDFYQADANKRGSEIRSSVRDVPVFIKPPVKDTETNTCDIDYDYHLYVRVYKPEGLDYRELKCRLICGKESYKTEILDPLPETGESQDQTSKVSDKSTEKKQDVTTGDKIQPGFDECLFNLPEKLDSNIWQPPDQLEALPDHLRASVHYGHKEDMVAMATIDMVDLFSLELPTVVIPPPDDAADVITHKDLSLLENDTEDEVSVLGTSTIDSLYSKGPGMKFNLPKKCWNVDPVNFPLYSTEAGRGDALHKPCGQLPLVLFWVKKIKPKKFNKMTEADNLRDIVLDLTGIDLYLVTKEELHPDMTDRSVSAMSIEPEEKPDTVLQSDYDQLLKMHQKEMEMLQQEYEQRLQDLAESIHQMQETAERQVEEQEQQKHQYLNQQQQQQLLLQQQQQQQQHQQQQQQQQQRVNSWALSRSTSRSTSPHPPDARSPHPPATKQSEPAQRIRNRAIKNIRHWREDLPKDFLDRLRWFEEASLRHKQDLADKTCREVSEQYEKKLAVEFKLGGPCDDDTMYNPLQDVSLPAVFMPSKGRDLTIFNPRASKYFHATGAAGLRLTQPPSMLQLPPLPKSKVSVVNLFDVSNNFRPGGNEWLIQRYMHQQQQQKVLLEQQQQQQQRIDMMDQDLADSFQESPEYSNYTPGQLQPELIGNSMAKESMLE